MLVNRSLFLLLPVLAQAMPRWHWHHPSPAVDPVDPVLSPTLSIEIGQELAVSSTRGTPEDPDQLDAEVEALARTRTRTRTRLQSSTALTSPTTLPIPSPSISASDAPTSSAIPDVLPAPAPADCQCGYVLSAYNNAYFPLSHSTSFSSLSGAVTQAQMAELGWEVAVGYQAGARNDDGTTPIGSLEALSGGDGALLLTVAGGQARGGEIKVGEIIFKEAVTGGVFTMNAELDATPGTCQSIFTYHTNDGNGDEQDIEVLGQTIFDTMDNGTPPGLQLTNYDPSGSSDNDNTIVPFPSDPTASFHDYTIAWLPDGTKYYYDTTSLKSPTKYTSQNPSSVIINHWSAGIEGFTQGPPTEDVVMKVKSVKLYYQTASQSGLPSGCSLSDACSV